jgi:hypothetical protein
MCQLWCHVSVAWNVFLFIFQTLGKFSPNMLENLQNLKCFLPHESQKVLIYFKDTNLSNGHNCPWLKENNHLMKFLDSLAYICIFRKCLWQGTRFLYQIFLTCKEADAQDIFELPKYDLLQVGKKEKSRFLLDF